MEITKKQENGVLTIILKGRLDTMTSPLLEREVKQLDGITSLVFDMENLEYISSAGLRVLLLTQKTMAKQGTMKLVNVCADAMEVFNITGFADFLIIE